MKKRNIRFIKITSLLLLVSFVLNGCIDKNTARVYSKEDGANIITYNLGKAPENLSKAEPQGLRQQDLFIMLFEGLVTYNENGDISAGIADNWKISKDGITYIFKIREDAYFSDGSDINAEDFVDFFSKILKDNNSYYNEKLDIIFGVKEYREGKREFKNVAIRAKDHKTLEIRLNKKDDNFLNILALPDFCIRKIDGNLPDWKKEYKNILYTGPYVVQNISKGGTIDLILNSRYWGWCQVKCKEIHITTKEVPEATMAAFDAGNVDIGLCPPKSEVERLDRDKSIMHINNDILYKKSNIFGIYYTKLGNIKLDRAYKQDS